MNLQALFCEQGPMGEEKLDQAVEFLPTMEGMHSVPQVQVCPKHGLPLGGMAVPRAGCEPAFVSQQSQE